jgi:SAM-dependent methyltransferase
MNHRAFEFFLQLHHGIPRQGPGTEEATARAFRHIEGLLPVAPSILDVGCGSGGQTLTIAALTGGSILAVDVDPALIGELRRAVAGRRLRARVTAEVGDMHALGFPPGRFDLVWCEGAMFVLGFEEGLRTLRPLLRGPGLAVVSEAVWLRPAEEAPAEVRAFWEEGYPAMAGVEETLGLARRAGYVPVHHFTLPEAGWAAYVDPLERRMEEVLALNPGDPDAAEAARRERREFEMFRKHLRWFGYEFFLLRRG